MYALRIVLTLLLIGTATLTLAQATKRPRPPIARPAPAKEKEKEPARGTKPGDEFLGRWQHKLRIRADLTITRSGDDFEAKFEYFDLEDKPLGSSHGENFKLTAKNLMFKVVYDKRPEPTWKDASTIARVDDKGQLLLAALGGIGKPETSTFVRVGDAAASEEKKTDVPEVVADDFKVLINIPIKIKPGDVDGSVQYQAVVSPQGDHWALYRRKGEVELRSLPDDKLVRKLTIKGFITYLQFSGDGQTLAAASSGGEERQLGDPRPSPNETAFFNVADGERRALIDHAGVNVIERSAALSPDGKFYAFTSRQPENKSKLAIWNTETQKQVLDYDDAWRDPGKLSISADGKKLALAGKPILTFDIGPGTRKEMEQPQLVVRHIALSPDGKLLALSGEGGEIALINTATGKVAHQFRAYEHTASNIVFIEGGKIMLTTGGQEHSIRAYDRAGKVVAKIPTGKGTPGLLTASADGKYVSAWVYGTEQSIQVWTTPWGH